MSMYCQVFHSRQLTGFAGSGDRIVTVSDRSVGTRGLYPGESVVTPIILWIGKSGLMEHSNGIGILTDAVIAVNADS